MHDVEAHFPERPTRLAIIGMAGQFPGALTPAQLWQNIVAGKRSIFRFSREELQSRQVDAEMLRRAT